jgi:hypothetical protein
MPSGRASTSAANLRTEACSPLAAALMRAAAIRVLVLLRPTIARLAPSAASASAAAIGGTRDQDLLVVHGTAIQGSVHVRMIGSMIRDLTNQR